MKNGFIAPLVLLIAISFVACGKKSGDAAPAAGAPAPAVAPVNPGWVVGGINQCPDIVVSPSTGANACRTTYPTQINQHYATLFGSTMQVGTSIGVLINDKVAVSYSGTAVAMVNGVQLTSPSTVNGGLYFNVTGSVTINSVTITRCQDMANFTPVLCP